MPRRNIHCLSNDERDYFNSRYSFDVIQNDNGPTLVVKIVDYNRQTRRPLTKSFYIRTCIRKLTITVEAIEMWHSYFYGKQKEYSLIDIQDAMNKLTVSYQELTYENVLDVLKHSKRK